MSDRALGEILEDLYLLLETRKRELPEGSYTAKLFSEGDDAILAKISEEAAEVVSAARATGQPTGTATGPFDTALGELVWEASDLLFHLLVLLVDKGVTLDDIAAELERRHESPPRPGTGLQKS